MKLKPKEKLLQKLIKQFPYIFNDKNLDSNLEKPPMIVNGQSYQWSNFKNKSEHIFSYNSIKECLDNPIKALAKKNNNEDHLGWEISVK